MVKEATELDSKEGKERRNEKEEEEEEDIEDRSSSGIVNKIGDKNLIIFLADSWHKAFLYAGRPGLRTIRDGATAVDHSLEN
jgi:hypothetical protein